MTNQASAQIAGNFSGDAKLVGDAGFDYRLQASSPAIGAAVPAGQTGGGFSLTPTKHYVPCLPASDRRSDTESFPAGTISVIIFG